MRIEPKESACWDEPLTTALRLLTRKLASPRQIQAAVDACHASRPKIGALALVESKLKVAQVFQILREQATSNEYFGEIAVRLGFLNRAALCELLWLQVERTPKLLDVLVEQGAITKEQKADLSRSAERPHNRLTALATAC
jgi:hypothetical protein